MANTPAVTFTVAEDKLSVTVADTTTYTSPTRATCGVFLNVYKTNYDGSQTKLTLTLDDDDPNVTASAVFSLDDDGWFQVYYFAPPDYSGAVTYAKYDAVFDPSGLLVYRSKQAGNTGNALNDTAYWEVIVDPAALAANDGTLTDSTNTDQAIFSKVFATKAEAARDEAAVEAAQEACFDCERSEDVDLFQLLDLFVVAMEKADLYSEFAKGERIARRAEALL